jgi:hypothetical protein
MKIIKLISLALLMSFSSLQAQIEVSVADISNFWTAFDSLDKVKDKAVKAEIIQKMYLDKGSWGVKFLVDEFKHKPSEWVDYIEKNRETLLQNRTALLSVLEQKPEIDAKLAYFKQIYPPFQDAKVAFLIGVGIFGGQVPVHDVLIGAEVIVQEKKDWAVHYIAHEFVHSQQKLGNFPLLAACMNEGTCDFVSELIDQKELADIYPRDYIGFGNKNEAAIWDTFKLHINCNIKGKFFNFLYGTTGVKINGQYMTDLGYFMGYKISKAYYQNAIDKKQALIDIISLDYADNEKVRAFVLKSGYVPKKDVEFVKNFVFERQITNSKKLPLVEYGYKIVGDNLVFTFDVPESITPESVKSVTLAGSFNDWNPANEKYDLKPISNKTYVLNLPLSKFEKSKKYSFKFVVNRNNWQDGLDNALNIDEENNGNLTFLIDGQKVMTFQEAEKQGKSYQHLDSLYKSAIHSDTSQAVFKSPAEQQILQKAYVGFLKELGGFLKANNFKWEKLTRCFNRIYINSDGTVDYFLYKFSKDQITEEKEREFERLLTIFLKDHKFSASAKVKFAQCSPVKYND